MVIVFSEIRRDWNIWSLGFVQAKTGLSIRKRLVNELDDAIQYMSKRRIGALISIEMETD